MRSSDTTGRVAGRETGPPGTDRASPRLAGWLLLVLPACGVLPREPGTVPDVQGLPREHLDELLGPGVVGRSVEAPVIDDPVAYVLDRPRRRRFRLRGDCRSDPGWEWDILERRREGGTERWRQRVGGASQSHLVAGEGGDVLRVAQRDAEEGVITRFTPAEWVLPEGLQPGESRSRSMSVEVVDADQPGHVRHTGHLDMTITYLGACEVRVPAGRFYAVLIEERYEGEVGPANVTERQYSFYARGEGLVASAEDEHITAYLIYRRHRRCARLLLP